MDRQVKVRGYRIEPGEIEAVLMSQGGIAQAIVELCGDKSEEKRLVGYVVRKAGWEELKASELRNYLKARLPDYMVPAALVVLDAFPLTANGKVDRKSLPPAPLAVEAQQGGFTTAVEEIVAGIWEQVLKVQGVGRQSNFFDLGGHSLSAMQVIARIRNVLGVDLPVRTLFESPTLGIL